MKLNLGHLPEYGKLAPLISMTPEERDWLSAKWREIRTAQTTADGSNSTWKQINAALNVWLDESGIKDVVQRQKIKGESLALKDALDVGKWHSANATRHIADVQLFLQMKQMGLL